MRCVSSWRAALRGGGRGLIWAEEVERRGGSRNGRRRRERGERQREREDSFNKT